MNTIRKHLTLTALTLGAAASAAVLVGPAPTSAAPGPEGVTDTPVLIDPASAPDGATPQGLWAEGTHIHLPGDRGFDLPAGLPNVAGLTMLDDDTVVVMRDDFSSDATPQVWFFGIDGTVKGWKHVPSTEFVTNADHTAVAFIDGDEIASFVENGGATWTTIDLPEFDNPEVEAAGGSCAADDCAIVVRFGESTWELGMDYAASLENSYAVEDLGQKSEDGWEHLAVTRLDGIDGSDPASGLVAADNTKVWEQDAYGVRSFSPDYAHVLAGNAWSSGFGDSVLAFLDPANGAPTAEFTTPEGLGIPGEPVWEDEDHVLFILGSPDEPGNVALPSCGGGERRAGVSVAAG